MESREEYAEVIAIVENPDWDRLTSAEQKGKILYVTRHLEKKYERHQKLMKEA